MFKKLLIILTLTLWASLSLAATEVNTADKATLQGLKEVGAKTADAIVAERTKGGNFKDWNDLVKRVKGVGPKNSVSMSQAGLTVNGQAKANTPAPTKKSIKATVVDSSKTDITTKQVVTEVKRDAKVNAAVDAVKK